MIRGIDGRRADGRAHRAWARVLGAVAGALCVSAAGCATAPVSYMGVTAPGKESAYECVIAQLNFMNYTIEAGDAGLGFVRARKQTSGLATEILTGASYHDVMTVSVFDDPSTGTTNIRAETTRLADKDSDLLGGLVEDSNQEGRSQLAPSESGKAEARSVLSRCGVGQVSGPSETGEGVGQVK